MTKDIKVYKELTMIKLKDGTVLHTEATIEQVSEMINTMNIITIDGVGFHKFDVDGPLKRYEPTDVDGFILSQPKELRNKLYRELDIRKEMKRHINLAVVKIIIDRLQK